MRPISLFIFMLASLSATCQTFDSLRQNIILANETGNDSITMERMLDLLKAQFNGGVPSKEVFEQVDNCIQFADEYNIVKGNLQARKFQARLFNREGQYDKTIKIYNELADRYSEIGDRLRAAQMLDNIGSIYATLSKVDSAIYIKLNALELFKEVGDSLSLAICNSGIARTYIASSRTEEAIKYCHEAIKYRNVEDPKSREAFEYHYLAICYKHLNQPDSSLYYYLKCRESSGHIKFLYNDNEAKLGEFYVNQGEFENAMTTFENLISTFDSKRKASSLQYYRVLYALALYEIGNLEQSEHVFQSIDTSQLNKRNWTWSRFGETGYLIEKSKNNYSKALEYYKIQRDYRDSINNVERSSRFKEIESKYNVAEKEKIISQQDVKLKNRLILIGGLMSLLLIGFVIYRGRVRTLRYQKRISDQDSKLKATEIEKLKQENKIISMQSLLEGQEEERKRIARDLHDNIGSLMTSIKLKILGIQKEIDSIEKLNITDELDSMISTASQEVRRISHSMTPVAMDIAGLHGAVEDLEYQLSSNHITYLTDIDDLEQITDKRLGINIFRIIQESINNTIKYANASSVQVTAHLIDDQLHLDIEDDGKGFELNLWEKSDSIGLAGIKARVEYLGGTVDVNVDRGTHYSITIPI